MTWLRSGNLAFPYYSPSQDAPVVFMNAIDGDSSDNQWRAAEIPQDAPDAVAAHVIGILIITHPGPVNGNVPTADLHLRLRRFLGSGNAYSPGYIGQICEAQPGGVRSPFAAWVALEDRKFEWHWTRTTPPPYPQYPSYGISLWVDAVVCKEGATP